MIILGKTLIAIATILNSLLVLVMIIVIAQAIISWVNADPYNPIVRFLNQTTEPLLRPLRRFIPPIGGRVDITPIILIFIITFLRIVLVGSLVEYGSLIERRGLTVPISTVEHL